ncbi:MAG: phosphoserine phosphatase SerB [Neisseriales bacterium]|nr:MAG: phosphoserine phosphatase SerB [Neisseriales bacterium]
MAQKVDIAWVNANTRFTDFSLIFCDMDSTFIQEECIDEIAAQCGFKSQVTAMTQETMAGNIDFASALCQRVALLKGLPESALDAVYKNCITLTPGAKNLVDMAHQHGIRFMLLSGGFSYFAQRLKQDYQLDAVFANELKIRNGQLTGSVKHPIIDGQAKANLLIKVSQSLGLSLQQVIAIGDGANDILMLQNAGVGIAFHAKPQVVQAARYALQYSNLDAVRWLFQ